MVIDLASRPRFFVGDIMSLGINRAVDLAISKAILIRTNVAIGFSGLSLG